MTLALDRLQRALERIAAAGATLEEAVADERAEAASLRTELGRMEERHRRLRASAASAIEQLDGLMAPAGVDGRNG